MRSPPPQDNECRCKWEAEIRHAFYERTRIRRGMGINFAHDVTSSWLWWLRGIFNLPRMSPRVGCWLFSGWDVFLVKCERPVRQSCACHLRWGVIMFPYPAPFYDADVTATSAPKGECRLMNISKWMDTFISICQSRSRAPLFFCLASWAADGLADEYKSGCGMGLLIRLNGQPLSYKICMTGFLSFNYKQQCGAWSSPGLCHLSPIQSIADRCWHQYIYRFGSIRSLL